MVNCGDFGVRADLGLEVDDFDCIFLAFGGLLGAWVVNFFMGRFGVEGGFGVGIFGV